MDLLQIDSLKGLKNNQGFWDHFVWPLAVALVVGVFVLFRKIIFKPRIKKASIPVLHFTLDRNNNILFAKDKELLSKLDLIKQLIRNSKADEFKLTIIPNYKINNLDKFQKTKYDLQLKNKTQEIKDKIEILLLKFIDLSLENSAIAIKNTLEGILQNRPCIVTGRIKIDIYRNYNPKISFPVYLTKEEFMNICKNQNIDENKMKQQLSIPTMTTMSIFPQELLYIQVIPELVNEIYRIKTRYNFDIHTNDWANLLNYEVGLG